MNVRIVSATIPTSRGRAVSPLPPLSPPLASANTAGFAEVGGGGLNSVFPYLIQAEYERVLEPVETTVVILENEHLYVEVLPEYGGRVWRMRERHTGRDLVHCNEVIQLGNLALRNAWFCGGIEFNIGVRGHSPHTTSPLHTAMVTTPDNQGSLRMWEYERISELTYQIDLWLPPDSRTLLSRITVRNTRDVDVPLYWWTNAAISQSPDVQVICDAETAVSSNYDGTLTTHVLTETDGGICRPADAPVAVDYFFDIDSTAPAWVAAADADGHGLTMLSDATLTGRKLFCWGNGRGGRRWQSWLSPVAGPYAEIQSGLTRTQYQYGVLEAGSEIAWTEMYGDLALAPGARTERRGTAVTRHGSGRAHELWSGSHEVRTAITERSRMPPGELVVQGSGWGALEESRRQSDGEPSIGTAATPFLEQTLGDEQVPWQHLLVHSALPGQTPELPPVSYVAGESWKRRLGEAASAWDVEYHLAVMQHACGDLTSARAHYLRSIALTPSAWAHRGLAVLAYELGDRDAALGEYRSAISLAHDAWLVEEAAGVILASHPAEALLALRAASGHRRASRLALLEARALASIGESSKAAALLRSGLEVPDLREGETILSETWRAVFPGVPTPDAYDFEMT